MENWQTPKEDWAPIDGVEDTDLNRIEQNISVLHGGNGQESLAPIASGANLAINETDETFIITGEDNISFISIAGRQAGNRIILIHGGSDDILLVHQASSPPTDYANLYLYERGSIPMNITWHIGEVAQLVYNGTSWYWM